MSDKYRICFSNDLSDPKNQVNIVGQKEPLDEFNANLRVWIDKAKAFDEINSALKEVLSDVKERGTRLPADIEKFSLLTERVIRKYESGEK